MTDIADQRRRLAEAVKAACIAAAEQGYEQAAASGLCDEGALEAAIGAVRMLDVDAIIAALPPATDTPTPSPAPSPARGRGQG